MTKIVNDYILEKPIGRGSFADVYRSQHRPTKKYYAIKVINRLTVIEPRMLSALETEIAVMKEFHHINVLQLKHSMTSEKNFYLVLEYCEGGDLLSLLRKKHFLSEMKSLHFLSQITEGLWYLHQKGYIHRDLKSANVLLSNHSEYPVIKLADFGFARSLIEMANTRCGTPMYMAPEVLEGRPYKFNADLWSLGCLFFEMLTGKCPFSADSESKLLNVIRTSPIPLPKDLVIGCESIWLLVRLLEISLEERIVTDELWMRVSPYRPLNPSERGNTLGGIDGVVGSAWDTRMDEASNRDVVDFQSGDTSSMNGALLGVNGLPVGSMGVPNQELVAEYGSRHSGQEVGGSRSSSRSILGSVPSSVSHGGHTNGVMMSGSPESQQFIRASNSHIYSGPSGLSGAFGGQTVSGTPMVGGGMRGSVSAVQGNGEDEFVLVNSSGTESETNSAERAGHLSGSVTGVTVSEADAFIQKSEFVCSVVDAVVQVADQMLSHPQTSASTYSTATGHETLSGAVVTSSGGNSSDGRLSSSQRVPADCAESIISACSLYFHALHFLKSIMNPMNDPNSLSGLDRQKIQSVQTDLVNVYFHILQRVEHGHRVLELQLKNGQVKMVSAPRCAEYFLMREALRLEDESSSFELLGQLDRSQQYYRLTSLLVNAILLTLKESDPQQEKLAEVVLATGSATGSIWTSLTFPSVASPSGLPSLRQFQSHLTTYMNSVNARHDHVKSRLSSLGATE